MATHRAHNAKMAVQIRPAQPNRYFYMKLVKPHRLISREVTAADIDRIRAAASDMAQILWNERGVGIYPKGGYALAHCQVDDKEPLRFFVAREGVVYVNPEIINHTNHEHLREEGCLTYSFPCCKALSHVPRWNKIRVRFQVLTAHGLSAKTEEDMKGLQAQVFQHEIDHFNGMYIYDRAGIEAPKHPEEK